MLNLSEQRLYTENGMLASIEDARHNVTEYEYDGLDSRHRRRMQGSCSDNGPDKQVHRYLKQAGPPVK